MLLKIPNKLIRNYLFLYIFLTKYSVDKILLWFKFYNYVFYSSSIHFHILISYKMLVNINNFKILYNPHFLIIK